MRSSQYLIFSSLVVTLVFASCSRQAPLPLNPRIAVVDFDTQSTIADRWVRPMLSHAIVQQRTLHLPSRWKTSGERNRSGAVMNFPDRIDKLIKVTQEKWRADVLAKEKLEKDYESAVADLRVAREAVAQNARLVALRERETDERKANFERLVADLEAEVEDLGRGTFDAF